MIAQEKFGPTISLAPRVPFWTDRSSKFDSSNALTPFISAISELFGTLEKLKCFLFNKIQTLFAKHRGWGSAVQRPPQAISNVRYSASLCFHDLTNCFS